MRIDGLTGFAGLVVVAIMLFVAYQAGRNQWLG